MIEVEVISYLESTVFTCTCILLIPYSIWIFFFILYGFAVSDSKCEIFCNINASHSEFGLGIVFFFFFNKIFEFCQREPLFSYRICKLNFSLKFFLFRNSFEQNEMKRRKKNKIIDKTWIVSQQYARTNSKWQSTRRILSVMFAIFFRLFCFSNIKHNKQKWDHFRFTFIFTFTMNNNKLTRWIVCFCLQLQHFSFWLILWNLFACLITSKCNATNVRMNEWTK